MSDNRKQSLTINVKELDDRREIAGWISTIDVDMVGDVVLPEGMDDSYYKTVKSLTLHHSPMMPVGVCRTYQPKPGKGVWARFYLSKTRPGDEALTMVREGVLGSFSIEWDGASAIYGDPTGDERKRYGDGCRRVFRKWKITGVSLVPQPMNATANVVEKSIRRLHELIAAEQVSVDVCKALGWPEPPGRTVSLPPRRVVMLEG